ncbi:hypothetical protein [Roseivivax sp. CAU 1753]
MLTSVMPSQLAPLATAHPQGLPARSEPERTSIRPTGDTETTGLADERGRDTATPQAAQTAQKSGGTGTSDDHAAPPTIMQMKIAALQSETRATDAPDDAASSAEKPDLIAIAPVRQAPGFNQDL